MFSTALPTRKRRRPEVAFTQGRGEVKFGDVKVYLVERRMGKSRRNFLSNLARSKGFCVDDALSGNVTHVVSEGNAAQELWNWLEEQGFGEMQDKHVLNVSWFTESMSAGRPVPVELRHYIQNPAADQRSCAHPSAKPEYAVSQYACQRRTTSDNHNKIFTDALEVLAENMEFSGNQGPCLAFRRAASVLKSLPAALQCLEETHRLPCLGEHSKAIVEEIFECGSSSRVEEVLNDEKYRTMKLFSSVFGVGPKTAESWYYRGLRTFEQVLTEPSIRLNRMQTAGFLFYEDISKPVSRTEAIALKIIVEEAVIYVNPHATVNVAGGFRRGKEFGHDVDFIIKTPEPGQEDAILPAVIERFKSQNILLYSDFQESTFDLSQLPNHRFEAMDHFSKCFLIVKLKREQESRERETYAGASRDWKAVRVDLLAPPVERYAYALLGWTGSTLFERDLRRFARLERGKLLDNHVLYDKATKAFLPASTEEDIFAHLGLEFIEPWQRNA
ncbi:DNA nucleotidylexotransferase isoform X1 [Megalobrama amblycephala]|uniref:DNA nucleotidylexotransferase isoform X1 n=1 Tax=Megalobrama amblycephala TaxID=75352 RepID=UPI002013DC0E|nr:DNA nucleotidylexotransferase isoform X1 [Megalobrama amblycephala]XP_048059971.1 DNA nucleotidylexotransferase isoform X1 [Megalobrama amblycephala]XP_048059972.1 DNA nucleotidylexotransferase isoform X1 [Megalobrama amblycephala]XP_048059973.1 DNA nucleotidylexotransferase isoform X1 [Megalobrama amblycephala]